MSIHVVDSAAMNWADGPAHGERFASRSKRLGAAASGKRLGCSLWEVEPGKTAFPMHAHLGVEEALYILAGSGTLRLGEARIRVGPGTYVALPPSADLPHQLLNTGTEPLRYLCLSAASDLDVCLYPDTGKVLTSQAPWPDGYRTLTQQGETTGYFDGESEQPVRDDE
ncbi:MAG: cupin domain-containing protein [Myxococcales bacterium]|nr:cupin domain-containing protein [Myxococcales bacterium]